jgi:hypothetical protein
LDDMMPMIVPWIALPTNLPMCTLKDKLAAGSGIANKAINSTCAGGRGCCPDWHAALRVKHWGVGMLKFGASTT